MAQKGSQSQNAQQSHNTQTIYSVFILLFIGPLFMSVWNGFSLQLCHSLCITPLQCRGSILILYSWLFISSATMLHIYLCKCVFYKVILYQVNQNFIIIFINTKYNIKSIIQCKESLLQPCDSGGLALSPQSRLTSTNILTHRNLNTVQTYNINNILV